MQKFLQNKKISNLGPKMWGNFKVEFEKANFIFEINTLDFINKQIFMQKKGTWNLDPNCFILVLTGCNFEKLLS